MFDIVKKLCAPARLYLVVSMIAILIMAFQNIGNTDIYCIGNYTCSGYSTILIFVIKVLYVIFWTWILNLICKSGASYVSWILVLLPFVLFFLTIAVFMIWGN